MATIAFVNPSFGPGHYSRASRSPSVTKSGTVYYPLWLCYAAGLAEDRGHNVSIIDAAARLLPHSEVVRQLTEIDPAVVVLDTTTPSVASDLKLAGMVKDAVSDCRIIAVGTHASALPEEVLSAQPAVDAAAIGEYDLTVSEYAEQPYSPAEVPGIARRKDKEMHRNPGRELITDLDALPFVSRVYRDHLDIRDYFWSTALHPMVMIITGRGCPNRCAWCLYPQTMHGRSFRYRSPENVVNEFEFVTRELPEVREIGIEDDTFTANRRHARQVCELLLERGIRMRWWANVRANLDFETMELMKRAGCRLFIVGFEAGTQDVLDAIHKNIRLEHIERFMENARRLRVDVRACFVAGQMGETRESLEATLQLALRLNPETAQFFPMVVYPGTEAYDWAKEKGLLATEDYSRWLTEDGTLNSVCGTGALSPEEIMEFVSRATRRFYLRPRVVARTILRSATSYREFRRTMRVMARFWRFLLK